MSGKRWLRRILLTAAVTSLLLGLIPPLSFAARIKIGERTVGGMKIVAGLEELEEVQKLVHGRWRIVKPGPGVTDHFEVELFDPKSGHAIPYAQVSARFVNLATGTAFAARLVPMYEEDLHYGANVRFAPARYAVTVTVKPPTMVRHEPVFNCSTGG